MGLFSNIKLGDFVTKVGQTATNLLNTDVAKVAANAAVTKYIGPTSGNVSSGTESSLDNQQSNYIKYAGGKEASGDTAKKVSWWQKAINFYKLGDPEVLQGAGGSETLNYVFDKDGKKQLNWMKIAGVAVGGIVIIGGIWYLMKPKKHGKTARRRRAGRRF